MASPAAAPIPENPIIVNVGDSYGCMMVGGFLSCMIWGVSCLQTFLYFSNYWDIDSWQKKTLVACLWVLDTVNEILLLKPLWPVLIANFGSIAGLSKIQPELTHHAWVAGLVAFSVQLFFVHRIYIFSGKKIIFPILMFILSLYQLVILIPYDILIFDKGTSTKGLAANWATDITISLRATTAAEDIIIACAMIFLVLKEGLPAYRSTRRIVYRLVLVTFNTGFWTAVVALTELAMVAHFPNGLQFMVLEAPLGSLYFTSLLANLNSREYIKGADFTTWNDSEEVSGSAGGSAGGGKGGRGRRGRGTGTEGTGTTQSAGTGGVGMTFRLWPMEKTGHTAETSEASTIKIDTTQVSDADVDARGESLDEVRYKVAPDVVHRV